MRRQRPDARIGDALGADRVARLGDLSQHAEQRAVPARADQQPLPGRHDPAAPQPAQGRLLVVIGPAKALVAQQVGEVAGQLRERRAHAGLQGRLIGLGRQVHGEVDRPGPGRRGGSARPGRARRIDHEGPLADAPLDQAAPVRLDIAAGHGREVQADRLRQGALRRQTHARAEAPRPDVVRQGLRDGQIMGLAPALEVGRPRIRHAGPAVRPPLLLRRLHRFRAQIIKMRSMPDCMVCKHRTARALLQVEVSIHTIHTISGASTSSPWAFRTHPVAIH